MSDAPRVWVLQGKRAGDNAQACELARRLGWPFETRTLRYNHLRLVPNLLNGCGLLSVAKRSSEPLLPPWPDLVIGAGKRMVPVALWIKRQSGGKARIIAIGRPRAPLAWFDLVVTTPQYGLPSTDNLIEVALPFALPVAQPENELAQWRATFAALPQPWTGVLVGGPVAPFRMTRQAIAALARRLDQQATGSLLVSTSPRTPPWVADRLEQTLRQPKSIFRWRPDAPNPHQAILALANSFVVTEDSVSMVAEAKATGRPVAVHPLQRSPFMVGWSAKKGLAATLARHGLLMPPRDNRRIDPRALLDDREVIKRIHDLMRDA
jgi:uncharacterized protein